MPEDEPQSITTPFDKEQIENKYHCLIDVERAEQVLNASIEAYQDHSDFFKSKKQAEEEYVRFMTEKQEEDDEFVINALFLLSIATFGSSSAVFYDGLAKDRATYERDRFLLVPGEVIKYKLLDEKYVKKYLEWIKQSYALPGIDLENHTDDIPDITAEEYKGSFNEVWRRYIHVKGRQAEALEGWYHNCLRIVEKYDGSVFNLFRACDNDAVKVLHALIDKPNGKSQSKEMKRFERKSASLFIQWVGTYNLYPLNNLEKFGLPVDFQLCRIAVQTGILNVLPEGKIRRKEFANNVFLPVIAYLCLKNGWEPRLVSESLWLIGSGGCTYDQRKKIPYYTCPIKNLCNGVMHKVPNDYLEFTYDGIREKLQLWGDYEKPHF